MEWTTVAADIDGSLARTKVTGSLDTSEFTVNDPEPLGTGSAGTSVRIIRPREHVHRLLAETAPTQIVIQLAVYLVKYPQVHITYDGKLLDPKAILDRETTIELDAALGGGHGAPRLTIMEWKAKAKTIKPSLILCDTEGVALFEITDGVDTRSAIPYTAYLMWPGFADRVNELPLAEMDSGSGGRQRGFTRTRASPRTLLRHRSVGSSTSSPPPL